MSLMKSAREYKRKLSRIALSKTVFGIVLFVASVAFTLVYSLSSVGWDPDKVGWQKMVWNVGIVVGLFMIGIFIAWMIEGQSVCDDRDSLYSVARRDYEEKRKETGPKEQYFEQFYAWDKANQISEMKARELVDVGWRSSESPIVGNVINATAHDIAYYATESDIISAESNEVIQVDHHCGHVFYISKITEEMAKKTIAILKKDEGIEFAQPSYYLTESDYDSSKSLPDFAQGPRLVKENYKKAVGSVVTSVLIILVWAILVAGAYVDGSYADSSSAWMNAISRISANIGGIANGLGIVDSYYDRLAAVIFDKIRILSKFYSCVMVDQNFIPDTRTITAKEKYDEFCRKAKERADKERADALERKDALEREAAEKERIDSAYMEYLAKQEDPKAEEPKTKVVPIDSLKDS